MNYKGLTGKIIESLGGEENIVGYKACMTRLKFEIKNKELLNKDILESSPVVAAYVDKELFEIILNPLDIQKINEALEMIFLQDTHKQEEPIQVQEEIINEITNDAEPEESTVEEALKVSELENIDEDIKLEKLAEQEMEEKYIIDEELVEEKVNDNDIVQEESITREDISVAELESIDEDIRLERLAEQEQEEKYEIEEENIIIENENIIEPIIVEEIKIEEPTIIEEKTEIEKPKESTRTRESNEIEELIKSVMAEAEGNSSINTMEESEEFESTSIYETIENELEKKVIRDNTIVETKPKSVFSDKEYFEKMRKKNFAANDLKDEGPVSQVKIENRENINKDEKIIIKDEEPQIMENEEVFNSDTKITLEQIEDPEIIETPKTPEIQKIPVDVANKAKETRGLFLRNFGDIFRPIVLFFLGSGLLKAMYSVYKNILAASGPEGLYVEPLYQALKWGSIIFYLILLIVVGASVAAKFKGTMEFGAMVVLLSFIPSFLAFGSFGTKLPMIPIFEKLIKNKGMIYRSQTGIMQIIIAVAIMCVIQRTLKKILPKVLNVLLAPIISIGIAAGLLIFILVPLTNILAYYLVNFLGGVMANQSLFGGFLISFLYAPMLLFGVVDHLASLATVSQLVNPLIGLTSLTSMGVIMAILLKKQRSSKLIESILMSIPMTLVGMSEAAIFGVILPFGRTLLTMCIASGLAGVVLILFNNFVHPITMKGTNYLSTGFTLLSLINPKGLYLICLFIAFVIGFLLTFILGVNKKEMSKY